jgi:hypothetical protein
MAAQNEAIQAFREGTNSIFRQWTALELAVHNGWGGHNSEEKANVMINEVLDLFGGSEKIYKDVSSNSELTVLCLETHEVVLVGRFYAHRRLRGVRVQHGV